MRLALLVSLTLSVTSPVVAQEQPASKDPRVQSIRYVPGQTIHLTTRPGGDVTILFQVGERIIGIQLDDYAHYQATLSSGGDSMVIHTNNVPSASLATAAMLRLSSDRRTYQIALANAGVGEEPISVVQIRYGRREIRADGGRSHGQPLQYRLTGAQEVRPTAVRDEGGKTYIQWAADAAVPAVFAVEHGREEMVEGYVRGGIYTIDRVYTRLLFRIDKHEARAQRVTPPTAE